MQRSLKISRTARIRFTSPDTQIYPFQTSQVLLIRTISCSFRVYVAILGRICGLIAHRYQRHLSRIDIPIKVVGVWDTVGECCLFISARDTYITKENPGSLGIPRVPWLERLHLQPRSIKEYLFFDTNLNNHIENAFQALALVRTLSYTLGDVGLT